MLTGVERTILEKGPGNLTLNDIRNIREIAYRQGLEVGVRRGRVEGYADGVKSTALLVDGLVLSLGRDEEPLSSRLRAYFIGLYREGLPIVRKVFVR